MSPARTWTLLGIAIALLALNLGIAFAIFHTAHRGLTVSFLDIGQGDSILITSPTGTRMLIDGGPDRSVLRELGQQLPPWQRDLDLVVETHPDKDHISGLADVFERYRIANFMAPGIPDTTATARRLVAAAAAEPGMHRFLARRGMRIHLGGGAYADVLFPDRDESHQTATNDGSVVLHVVYGATSVMLTGDLPSPYEDYLVGLDGTDGNLASDILKAGHHGSRYSTDSIWLAAVHPSIVAISAGKGNPYGHPNPETLARIEREGARIVSTMDSGTLTFVSDGRAFLER